MKFSIVIPCYKVEKYLSECVDSILSQTFTDYEIILVDDGSPDRVPEICDEYAKKDNRIRVIHQKNGGLSRARNAGIAEAMGDYVVCIDSDDYLLHKDVLQAINNKLSTNPDVVLYGYKKLYESDGAWGEPVVPHAVIGSVKVVIDHQLLNDTFTATAWTKAVRTSLLHNYKIEFTPGLISEDNDWYMRILCYAKSIVCLEEPCVAYRQRPGSISHAAKINSLTDNLWILETWPSRFDEIGIDNDLKSTLMSALAYFYANLLIVFTSYPRSVTNEYRYRLKSLLYLFDYAKTPRANIEKRFIKILGFELSIILLTLLSKIKKHQ